MSFGTKLQDARQKQHLTQEQLAELLGVTRQSISRWETDVVYPDLAKIVKLSEVLNVSTDYLLKNEEPIQQRKEPSKLLFALVGKKVSLGFYDESDPPLPLIERTKTIETILLGIDTNYVKVSITDTKKKTIKEISIPLSDISSIVIEEA